MWSILRIRSSSGKCLSKVTVTFYPPKPQLAAIFSANLMMPQLTLRMQRGCISHPFQSREIHCSRTAIFRGSAKLEIILKGGPKGKHFLIRVDLRADAGSIHEHRSTHWVIFSAAWLIEMRISGCQKCKRRPMFTKL